MFDRVGCSFPWAVVFASLLLVNAEPEAKNTTLKQLLLSKEVGHNLYHSYRSTLIKQGWSLLPKDVALTPSCFKDIVALRNDKMKMIKCESL